MNFNRIQLHTLLITPITPRINLQNIKSQSVGRASSLTLTLTQAGKAAGSEPGSVWTVRGGPSYLHANTDP
ncbi:hypothetical protein E2C01_027901 [Portunus trituberculatus]|uniref:Uncharacterized protein n=1 Tax=Portunus trituberculatus TaxID=210409 RepID=A0A5B7EMW4_PORTR|nr:hypothetical protein [Portunus trituberculatus]